MTIENIARNLQSSWSRYRARRAALRELSALDDRQLADIGLERGRIEEYVRGFAA